MKTIKKSKLKKTILPIGFLSAYLPYQIKLSYNDGLEIRVLEEIKKSSKKLYGNKIKPVLVPLSCLNYDIALSFYESDFSKFTTYKSYLENELLRKNKVNSSDLVSLDFSYHYIQYFLEDHYDVFGLIDKGLAIDINTLQLEK